MLHWNDDLAPRNETFSSFRSNSSIRCNKIPSGVTVYGDPRNDPDITCDESNIESHQSLTFPLVMDYYFFRQFAKVSSFPRKRDISPEVKKKKWSTLRVKEIESFPGGDTREMENGGNEAVGAKATRRPHKRCIRIANCVFGGLHRLPSNKPAIYSLRHAHRTSMS